MHSTAEINSIINKAKQQRAEYIGSKLQGSVLPLAFAALVTLALAHSSNPPSQAEHTPVVDLSAQNG
jgi:hypothetical protein